jgi:hypothetical protein
MKKIFSCAFLLVFLLLMFSQTASAQGGAPPALPTLEELLSMSLRAVGTFAVTALFNYYWGYAIAALLSRYGVALPQWAVDIIIILPITVVAAGWDAFAGVIDVYFPGLLDSTLGQVLLYLANLLLGVFFVRRGGLSMIQESFVSADALRLKKNIPVFLYPRPQ